MGQELEIDGGPAPLLEVTPEVVSEVGLIAVDEQLDRLDQARRHAASERVDADLLPALAPLLDEAGKRIRVGLVAELRQDGPDHGLLRLLDERAIDEGLHPPVAAAQRLDRVVRPLLGNVVSPRDRGEAEGGDACGRRLGELRHLLEGDVRPAQPLDMPPEASLRVERLDVDLVPPELDRLCARLLERELHRVGVGERPPCVGGDAPPDPDDDEDQHCETEDREDGVHQDSEFAAIRDEGQRSLRTQVPQRGTRARQTRRPCQIKRCGKMPQYSRGTSFCRSRSILTGSS